MHYYCFVKLKWSNMHLISSLVVFFFLFCSLFEKLQREEDDFEVDELRIKFILQDYAHLNNLRKS